MNYTFEPLKPDGSPRKFVGMFRLPYEQVDQKTLAYPHEYTYSPEAYRRRWLEGKSDRPLYEGDDGSD